MRKLEAEFEEETEGARSSSCRHSGAEAEGKKLCFSSQPLAADTGTEPGSGSRADADDDDDNKDGDDENQDNDFSRSASSLPLPAPPLHAPSMGRDKADAVVVQVPVLCVKEAASSRSVGSAGAVVARGRSGGDADADRRKDVEHAGEDDDEVEMEQVAATKEPPEHVDEDDENR